MKTPAYLIGFVGVVGAIACGGDADANRLRVGNEPDDDNASAGSSVQAGRGGGGGQAGGTRVGAGDNALAVHVENPSGLAIEIVTLQCAGDCADVVAVAHGGNPPYTFIWQDSTATATRHVCPDATTTYQVSVTDTSIIDDEFSYDAQTATAEVTARVLDCHDAGVREAGTDSGDLCLENPSFEGTVTATQFEAFQAAPWNACYEPGGLTYSAIGDATLWPTQNWTFPAASDGATYLALGQQLLFTGRASQVLCQPIAAGSAHSFLVDLARASSSDATTEAADPVLQVLGGAECAEDEVLWTSPPLTREWTTHCVTIKPQRDMTSLGFRPLGADGGLLEALVDHIVPIAECP